MSKITIIITYIVLIYLLYLTKDSSQKEHHHGEAVRLIPLHGYDIFSLPLAGTPSRWTGQRRCWRILFNYVNRLRKKLINTLIYLISFFNLLPTWSPRNWCDRAPLTSPTSFVSCIISPVLCLCVFSWLLCKIFVRRPPTKATNWFLLNFPPPHSQPQTTWNSPPHTSRRGHISSQTPPYHWYYYLVDCRMSFNQLVAVHGRRV